MADLLPAIPVGCIAIVQSGPKKGQPCGEHVASPAHPYCHKHLMLISRPINRGRYRDHLPEQLRENFDEHMSENEPKNLVPEIANLRTIISHLLEQSAALDDQGNLAISKKDLEFVYAGIKLVGELSERQSKISPDKFLPLTDVMHIISDILNIVRSHLNNQETMPVREKIAEDIRRYCENQIINRGEEENAERG